MNKYAVIYATPPWMYNKHYPPAEIENVQADKFWPQTKKMSVEEIIALPVKDLCEDNCVLFLWTPTPILQEAFTVMSAWGFSYKTLFTWEKTDNRHLGYWFKTCTEHLIIAIKGDVKAFGSRIRNCYHHRKLKHGRKPDFFYEIIEKVTSGKKVELFSQSQREGWDTWNAKIEPSPTTFEQNLQDHTI